MLAALGGCGRGANRSHSSDALPPAASKGHADAGATSTGPTREPGDPPIVAVCNDAAFLGDTEPRIAWNGSEFGVFFTSVCQPLQLAYARVSKDGARLSEPVTIYRGQDDVPCITRGVVAAHWRDGGYDVLAQVTPGKLATGILRVAPDGHVIKPWTELPGRGRAGDDLTSAARGGFNPTGFATFRTVDPKPGVSEGNEEVWVTFHGPDGKLIGEQQVAAGGADCMDTMISYGADSYLASCLHYDRPSPVTTTTRIELTTLRWSAKGGLLWKRTEGWPGPFDPKSHGHYGVLAVFVGHQALQLGEREQHVQPAENLGWLVRPISLDDGAPRGEFRFVGTSNVASPRVLASTGRELAVLFGGSLLRRLDSDGTALAATDCFVGSLCMGRKDTSVSDIVWTGDRYGTCQWGFSRRPDPDEPCPSGYICDERGCAAGRPKPTRPVPPVRCPNLVYVPLVLPKVEDNSDWLP